MSEQEKQASVPYFIHEGDMTRMETSVRSMRKALVTVCVTLVLVVIAFVAAYTINNNRWIDFTEKLTHAEEPANGVYEQLDTGANP